MNILCYVDGKFVEPENAKLPISDLIIQRGVGVFEALASINLKPLMLTPHMERFMNSAKSLGIVNYPDVEDMKKIIREGIAKIGRDVRVRTFLTGGDSFDKESGTFKNPRFFVLFDDPEFLTQEEFEKGKILHPVYFRRDEPSIKSTNYHTTFQMPPEAFDVLYCPDGEITEAGHSNFFLVFKNNTIVTAPLDRVLKGTTRGAILVLARENGIKVEERCPLWPELSSDDVSEAFVTGSIKMIIPIVKVGGTVIGDGKPGKITRKLSELYRKNIDRWLE